MKRTITKLFLSFCLVVLTLSSGLAQTEMLVGGNMENATDWTVTSLNTTVGSEATATWNYTTDKPTAGVDGNLYVSSTADGNQRQFCIYQAVHLSKDSVYNFNAAIKVLGAISNSWLEVFLGTKPIDGEDYGAEQTNLSAYNTWWGCFPGDLDDEFINACYNNTIVPDTTGTYFFVLKIGSSDQNFDVLLDELSLIRTASKPFTEFSADVTNGFEPLEVTFTDKSKFATSWAWDFGDGNTSTAQNPTHTYASTGTYDVSLTATNALGDSTVSKIDYITVNSNVTLPPGEMLYGGNMEDVAFWNTSLLNTEAGKEPTATWNYTTSTPTAGLGGNLHVTGTTNAGNSQYCIYQEVVLDNTKAYHFDGAYNAIQINNSWCEVFIGTEPVDGEDYGTDQFKLAAFGTWAGYNKADGIFSTDIDQNNYNVFVPETSGTYYFVVKMGSTSWDNSDKTFEVIIDELTLMEDGKPIADFSANVTNGIEPLEVVFTDESKLATSWAWNFGDGNSSTEQNPTHTYAAAGTYSVTLSATNADGTHELVKTDLITVNPALTLEAGGIIAGGDMSDATPWSINFLNTAAGNEPTLTWNDMTHTPSAGQGGALYIEGDAPGGQNTQVAIYQEVTLSVDSVYYFDAAFRDFDDDLQNAWAEAYIGTEPVTGNNYEPSETQFRLTDFTTWNGDCTPAGLDGAFSTNACNYGGFTPETSGTYYLVIRIGSWEGGDFQMAIDEISFNRYRVKPTTNFSADFPTGFVPLTANFTDESKFATSWAWDFGDGTTSTEQNPTHVYNVVGKYTVTLTATNEIGDSVLTKTEYITVNEKPELPEGEMLYGGNMENPDFWTITNLNASEIPTATWNYTDNTPTDGVGGNLHITATVNNSESQYCIWQPVELKAGSVYTFDGLFKDVTGVDHFWCEVFIGKVAPEDNVDYSKNDHQLIAWFNTWDGNGTEKGIDVDGLFSANAANPNNPFKPETDGTYYFVMKIGNTDWESTDYSFEVIIDELTLMESTPVLAGFVADLTTGTAPLNVQFFNQSENATTYHWDFGDGATSTEEEPSHEYTDAGTYTVTLVAIQETEKDTLIKVDLITVQAGNTTDIIDNKDVLFKVYPNPVRENLSLQWSKSEQAELNIYNLIGQKIHQQLVYSGNNKVDVSNLNKGMYMLKVEYKGENHTQRIIVE